MITKTVEQVIVPEQPDEAGEEEQQEEIVIREKVRVCPSSWATSFGVPVRRLLTKHHYAGDWDVLRPATELEEMSILTTEQLNLLMKEAESIMEGWTKTA